MTCICNFSSAIVTFSCCYSLAHAFSGMRLRGARPVTLSNQRKTSFGSDVSMASPGARHVAGFVSGAPPDALVVSSETNVFSTKTFNNTTMEVGTVVDMVNFSNPLCQIVALSDGKLPRPETFAMKIRPPNILEKLDAIYHAKAHEETRRFQYMRRSTLNRTNKTVVSADEAEMVQQEERQLVVALRRGLEDAGFELLSKRDYDLCEALNAGYLLRLSILPDIAQADPSIFQEFYPERIQNNTTIFDDDMLFEGRILIYWRGYNSEVTQGRLLLPKLDYLQANLVQRSAASIVETIGRVERFFIDKLSQSVRSLQRSVRHLLLEVVSYLPIGERLAKVAQQKLATNVENTSNRLTAPSLPKLEDMNLEARRFLRLGRYGGSRIRFIGSPNPKDALNPFLICEIPGVSNPPCPNAHSKYIRQIEKPRSMGRDKMDHAKTVKTDYFTCLYDEQSKNAPRATQLLERISIRDVVDSFSHVGRARLLASFFSKSELVEPSFDEVVVVWRPLSESTNAKKNRLVFPKLVYDVADMFDIDGLSPASAEPQLKPVPLPLEIRAFHEVPMANLLAVLPKTKLILRPADAFVFDFLSVASFLLIVGSQRFDSPKLDFLAFASVVFWIFRTFLRYRNKLTSYDLLVKTFLTSKISHRNAGALKYVATEAGSQRALRAALVYTWLVRRIASLRSTFVGNKTAVDLKVVRAQLEREGETGVNDLLPTSVRHVRVDVNAALNDLEELELATFSEDKTVLQKVVEPTEAMEALRGTWTKLF